MGLKIQSRIFVVEEAGTVVPSTLSRGAGVATLNMNNMLLEILTPTSAHELQKGKTENGRRCIAGQGHLHDSIDNLLSRYCM